MSKKPATAFSLSAGIGLSSFSVEMFLLGEQWYASAGQDTP